MEHLHRYVALCEAVSGQRHLGVIVVCMPKKVQVGDCACAPRRTYWVHVAMHTNYEVQL